MPRIATDAEILAAPTMTIKHEWDIVCNVCKKFPAMGPVWSREMWDAAIKEGKPTPGPFDFGWYRKMENPHDDYEFVGDDTGAAESIHTHIMCMTCQHVFEIPAYETVEALGEVTIMATA